jgi:hypothetical protein
MSQQRSWQFQRRKSPISLQEVMMKYEAKKQKTEFQAYMDERHKQRIKEIESK